MDDTFIVARPKADWTPYVYTAFLALGFLILALSLLLFYRYFGQVEPKGIWVFFLVCIVVFVAALWLESPLTKVRFGPQISLFRFPRPHKNLDYGDVEISLVGIKDIFHPESKSETLQIAPRGAGRWRRYRMVVGPEDAEKIRLFLKNRS